MKNTPVGLKELRENIESYVSQVKKGKTFVVLRRSKPLFKITPLDADEEGVIWERVADFTKIKKGGVPLADLLSRL